MAKRFEKCKLCDDYKLLNYAGLCKKCNSRKAAGDLIDKASEKRDAAHEESMKAAAKAEAAAEAAEEASEAAEEKSEGGEEAKPEEKE